MIRIIFIVVFLNISHLILTQELSDFLGIYTEAITKTAIHNHPEAHYKVSANTFVNLLNSPLYIYQKKISDQFQPYCIFTPSCSQFCINSIKTFGLIKGLLLTGDRLTRCSINNYNNYYRKHKDGLICDDSENYY